MSFVTTNSQVLVLAITQDVNIQRLEPDPLIRLQKVIGYSGDIAFWERSGGEIVYACQSLVIAMAYVGRRQRFFIGHTDKVSAATRQPHQNPTRTPPEPHQNPIRTPPEPHQNPIRTPLEPHQNPIRTPPEPHQNPTRTPSQWLIENLFDL